ncbi:aminodeoxychorismate synthase component I [Azospirillum sp. SYSU D00513]|uniref:aminodeoxychorismate synthase component I n=1 Tax=Azospirillum sp. SYSU D00513 TaxID=2812561 RepID=UPI001A96F8AD|nr:aminodeoxychorismate synthase component I [Azospirillum sp. SYSU D00513]
MQHCAADSTIQHSAPSPGRFDLLVREIPFRDPLAAFAPWAGEPTAALLHSAAEAGGRGRVTYLAVEPFRIIEAFDDAVTVDGGPVAGDPFTVLERELAAFRLPPGVAPVPFATGAVGFLGYELGRTLERLPARHGNDLGIPDMAFGLYDVAIAFDMVERRAWILSSGFPERDPAARQARAERRADAVAARVAQAPDELPPPPRAVASWRPELSREEYMARVARILEYIRAGDIFQANFTGRMLAPRPQGVSAYDIFRRLTALSPAPFAAYLGCGERLTLASVSPERFLKLDADGRIETRPIKGTRPRGATPEEDAALARDLHASVKDRAENLMITDLLRNDIGRVCAIGSVRVPALCEVETFASVHHLVSVIEGRLRPGLGPIDLLRATFPGGSITGAPKIRAMEIIDELEEARRGPYCGSVAWIGFDGAMDSSIVIRTLALTHEAVVAQAGGGIVADSDPGKEHDEMMVKIRPLLRALGED